MGVRVFRRDDEEIRISSYGFTWTKSGEIVKEGIVDNLDETIVDIQYEGFEEV